MKKLFILYIVSLPLLQSCSDSGNSKEQAPIMLSNVGNKASCVFLTKDQKNNPVISWAEVDRAGNKHVYFANWDARSQKFTPGIAIPIEPNTSIHEEGMPKIAFKGDGTIVATYETSVPSEKSRFGLSDIQYVMSFDKGKTWTAHKSIQPRTTQTGSRSFGNMIRLDDGEIGVSWLDTDPDDTNSGRPVKFSKTQGNEGFGSAVVIEPTACQCCRTAISSDGRGNVSVAFRNLLSGSVRDISIGSSADNGRTFGKTVPFSNDHWVIDGCPHNGPSVASSDEKTYVTWFTGSKQKGVFYAVLDKNNNMLLKRQLNPNGRFAQLCLMPDGTPIVAYNVSYRQGDSTRSKIIVNKINGNDFFEKEVTRPRIHASYPVVLAAGAQHVIIAWSENDKIFYTLMSTNAITDVAKGIKSPFLRVEKDEVTACLPGELQKESRK